MTRSMITRHKRILFMAMIALVMGLPVLHSAAQGNGPTLAQTAEYDIGFDCPTATALDPTGTIVWVLTDNCAARHYTLHAYRVEDGTPLEVDDWSATLESLDEIWIDSFIEPMAFTPQGDLSIRYSDPYTYESSNLVIPLASGGEATTTTSAHYNELLAGLSPYPEFSFYSPDHTRVAAMSETGFHIIDVQAESEIVQIPVEGALDGGVFVSFSADGERVYVIQLVNPENMDDFASNLLIYSLPDGALLKQYSLPYLPTAISPDETKAAAQLYSSNVGERSELLIVDLDTGLPSAASNLLEEPRPVLNCLNDGRDVSDVGFMTRGYLALIGLHWLPDSSGMVATLSAGGDGAAGDAGVCFFNYSRLRIYSVGG